MRHRFALALTVTLALVPACGNGTKDRTITTDGHVALRTYAALVEQHLSTVQTALTALAATEDARSGQWARLEPALTQVRDRVTTAAAVWFARPDGSYLTVGTGLASGNLSDRAYFPHLLAGHQVRGDLVVSKSTGKLSCIVAAPIRAGARVVGGLGASIDMVELADLVEQTMALPSTMVFYALDAHGQTALHINRANIFEFPTATGSTTLSSAVRKMLASDQGTVTYTYKGATRTVDFLRSKPTGWVFALGTADASR